MSKKINCIMIIDDNPDDNFFHERVIRKSNLTNSVVVKTTAITALEYLKTIDDEAAPDLIFLDINMPAMNGWEFLEQYDRLSKQRQGKVVVIMLTTSDNPDDKLRASTSTHDFKTKPLTKEMLEEIIQKYF